MLPSLTPNEEAQTLQTIEMFEVVVKADPSDTEALEILREAYFKLGRDKDVIRTSRRIAQAYVQLGQMSSAILEFESLLRRCPGDTEALAALAQISAAASQPSENDKSFLGGDSRAGAAATTPWDERPQDTPERNDGRAAMFKVFVDTKQITASDFDLFWPNPSPQEENLVEPFIQKLADKQLLPLEVSLKLLCEKSRAAFVPIDKYDVDIELARTYPRALCQRWCMLPFDRMSKSVLVATTNPFNEQAAREIESFHSQKNTRARVLWYIASPVELVKVIRKVFR